MMVTVFLSGMTAAMFLTAGVFFLKFWKASRNRFFAYFASACWLFSLERIISFAAFSWMGPQVYNSVEARGWIYILRLIGFILIMVAIVDRNRAAFSQRKNVRRLK